LRAWYLSCHFLHTHSPLQIKLQGEDIPGDLTTAHPKLLRDGRTFVNFSRTIPAGGFHVYTQDARTMERKQVAFIRCTCLLKVKLYLKLDEAAYISPASGISHLQGNLVITMHAGCIF
jgi:hypothetical protein